ncbi:MAG: hydroxymethylbilane synthase [Acidobacteriota bacterium]|nr:hydroxymethylbilane synthase [Acidobacteriota bacterium]MDE3043210.1 hydroxymethylbilane synthase [Acidobacteriota bacterium]MDE3106532.1 hydroxymethylbilane synthase [Acidobacteriota bacterium]MDE3222620.1 hydroxymethylbilane synthase [Acidobacteriota bacterium]
MTLRLATRRSPLATRQAHDVRERLATRGVDAELVFVETHGDRDRTSSLTRLGGVGVFAVEVQRAVLDGVADVAVHSAKDLPSLTPEGLGLVCVPERRDAADVLIGRSLAGLGPGATVATGSPRRRALLLERRPDLHVVELRGNMATRVARAGRDGVDAVVAAAAALERLGQVDLVAERLEPSWFVPQVGQGAIALEARVTDSDTLEVLATLNDEVAFRALAAERAYLRELGAGCLVPTGAYATTAGDQLTLSAVMLAPDGASSVRDVVRGHDPEALGVALARRLRDELGGGHLWAPERP